MTKREEEFDRRVESKVETVMRRWLVRVAALCITGTSAILTLVYNIGAWSFNNIEAISAAWKAFRGVR